MKSTSWFSRITGNALTLDNLQTVLVLQLQDLYSAEEQLIEALPKMEKAANDAALKKAFRDHLAVTKTQKKRLEKILRGLGEEPGDHACDGMKGLIAEGQEVINLRGAPDVKDAALIAAAQRVEHYEIAGYGCARTFARRLRMSSLADELQTSLEEEAEADELLTEVAEASVNKTAASMEEEDEDAAEGEEKGNRRPAKKASRKKAAGKRKKAAAR